MPVITRMSITGFILTALCGWSLFFGWLYWLIASEVAYKNNHLERIARGTRLEAYTLGETVQWTDEKKLRFYGWSQAEPFARWSADKDAAMFFALLELPAADRPTLLKLRIGSTINRQRVTIALNRQQVLEQVVSGPGLLECTLPAGSLKKGVNSLRILLPDARPPSVHDPRILGISLISFEIQPLSTPVETGR